MNEVDSLISEQKTDEGYDRVQPEPGWEHGRMRTNWELLPDNYPDDTDNYRVSWGKPAQLCQAKMDKSCPVCGLRMGRRPEDFQGSRNGEMAFWCPKRTVDENKYSLMFCARAPSILVLCLHQNYANIAVSEFSY